jgi:hypothetical protein
MLMRYGEDVLALRVGMSWRPLSKVETAQKVIVSMFLPSKMFRYAFATNGKKCEIR